MSQLPPPRLPGQPPDRPPVRRPDEHLPRPELIVAADPPEPAPPRRRLLALVAALAAIGLLIAAGSYVLVAGRSDADLDTSAAADTLSDAVADIAGDAGAACPVDDPGGVLARAFSAADSDEIFDAIDLGVQSVTVSPPPATSFATCQFTDATSPQHVTVGLTLSEEPDEYLGDMQRDTPADGDFVLGGDFGDGTIATRTFHDDSGSGFVEVAWANDDLSISVFVVGPASVDVDTDELRSGLEDVIPHVVTELAGTGD